MPFLSTAKRCAPLYVSANTVSGPVWPRSKKSGCARARPSSLHRARQDPLRRLRGIRAQPTGARLRVETAHLAHDRIPLPAGIQRASASATIRSPAAVRIRASAGDRIRPNLRSGVPAGRQVHERFIGNAPALLAALPAGSARSLCRAKAHALVNAGSGGRKAGAQGVGVWSGASVRCARTAR